MFTHHTHSPSLFPPHPVQAHNSRKCPIQNRREVTLPSGSPFGDISPPTDSTWRSLLILNRSTFFLSTLFLDNRSIIVYVFVPLRRNKRSDTKLSGRYFSWYLLPLSSPGNEKLFIPNLIRAIPGNSPRHL